MKLGKPISDANSHHSALEGRYIPTQGEALCISSVPDIALQGRNRNTIIQSPITNVLIPATITKSITIQNGHISPFQGCILMIRSNEGLHPSLIYAALSGLRYISAYVRGRCPHRPLKLAGFAIFFLLSLSVKAQTDSTSADTSTITENPRHFLFTGYIKDLQSASFINNSNQITTQNLIHNRLIFKYYAPANFTFDAEMRNRLYYGEEISSNPLLFSEGLGTDNGYFDLSKKVINANSMVLYSQFDRLNLNWHSDQWDVTVGRQRINWGVALAWNPNDVFNAYNLLDFDYEERPGNDAVRIQHYFTNTSSIELAAKPGRNADENIINALYKFNTHSYDVQFLGGLYNKDFDIGTGWAGNIANAGFKGEISYFHSKNKFADTTGTVEVSLSIDQSWDPGWYFSFSALYNSTGQTTVFNLNALRNTTLDASNLLPFKYSFLPGITKTFSPITSGSFSVLYAPGLNAVVFLPDLTYSISNSWTLDFIGQSFFATLNNKFQTAGNAIYLRTRWSF